MATNKHIPGGFKGFLALHAEKIVLGVCVALVALFFCLGYGIETIPDDQNPAALYVQVEDAKAYIAQDSWEDLQASRVVTPNHLARAVQSRKPIDGDYYAMEQYWQWPKFPLNEKRRKPNLYAPTDVVAWATVAPVVEPLKEGQVNRLEQLPPAHEDPPEETKPKKKPMPKPSFDDDEFSEDDEFLDEDLGLDDEFDDEEFDDGGGGRSGGLKVLSGTQRDEFVQGALAVNAMGPAHLVGRSVVVVTCLVPYGKQRKEFDTCFVNAMNYDADRDRPEYFYYVAERKLAGEPEDSWKVVSDTRYMLRLANHWRGVEAQDLVDETRRHPAFSAPVLPVLLQPARKLATHPKIPIKQDEEELESTAPGDGDPLDPLAPGEFGPMALGDPGAPPVEGDSSADEFDDDGGFDDGDGDEFDGDDFGDGSDEDFGDGDGDGDYSTGDSAETQYADQLLVRFYDLTAERGESYQYRVRLFVRDPNNPIPSGGNRGADVGGFNPNDVGKGHPLVPDRALDDQALQEVQAAREKNQYYLATDFSEPSPPVTVPELPLQLVAGPVEAPRYTPVTNGRVLREEAKANVLAVTWSDDFGIFIPGLISAARGALLNFTADADVLDPLQMELKELTQHGFSTDSVLLDIRGGKNLGTSSNPLYTPGEVLLLDRQGNLVVRNEIDDAEIYRRQLFIEDRGPESEPSYSGGDDGGLDDEFDEFDDGLDEDF